MKYIGNDYENGLDANKSEKKSLNTLILVATILAALAGALVFVAAMYNKILKKALCGIINDGEDDIGFFDSFEDL